jgi:hypothetical protein
VRVTQGHTITGNAPRYHWYLNKSLRLSLDHLLFTATVMALHSVRFSSRRGGHRRRTLHAANRHPRHTPHPINWAQSIQARPLHHTTSANPRFHVEHPSRWQSENKKTRHLGNSPKHRVSWGSSVGLRRRSLDHALACGYPLTGASRFQSEGKKSCRLPKLMDGPRPTPVFDAPEGFLHGQRTIDKKRNPPSHARAGTGRSRRCRTIFRSLHTFWRFSSV